MTLLTVNQLHELQNALATAGIVASYGGNWREVFRRKRIQYPCGYLNRIYTKLYRMSDERFDAVSARLVEDLI